MTGRLAAIDCGTNSTRLLVTEPDGTTVTYTPEANFHGTDVFTYTISDGQGNTALATVSLRGAAADVALRIVPRESPAPSRKGSHAAVSRVFSPGPSQVK